MYEDVAACVPMVTDGEEGQEGLPEERQSKRRLVLGLVDSEGCVVYYHLYQGVHPPPNQSAALKFST